MKNKLFVLSFLCLIILPIISADVIDPGYSPITVNNYITNINDFPAYIFISGGNLGIEMCPLEIIDDEQIGSYYKFCDVFVYAIPKDKFNNTKIEEINFEKETNLEEIKLYFNSIGGKEVITNINTYETKPISNSVKERKNYYTISLSQVKTQPDEIKTSKSNLIYFYILAPIIAILIIIFILIKRKK